MSISCYAARLPKGRLERFEYKPQPLGAYDVEVKITHCGICHSDIHLIDNDWGISDYPLVPGHEIAGTVTRRGERVRDLEEGQRVGIGWLRSACLNCEQCVRGYENLCAWGQATCVGNYGGFAEFIRIDGRFVFPLPGELDSESAAPLLCGGVTVFSPLLHFNVRPTMKVGVVGVGGLGHLALQFARAMGCEVFAFSSTPEKEEDARTFGTHHFVSSIDSGELEKVASTLDFVLVTVPTQLDWKSYIDILRPDGTLCVVGVPSKAIEIPAFSLIDGRKRVCGSPVGGRNDIRETLAFAVRHGIRAQTEAYGMGEVNDALDHLRQNHARYRVVLKT